MRRIIVRIEPDGQTLATAEGFDGGACRTATEFLSQALGNEVKEELTPAFYEQATATTQQENRW